MREISAAPAKRLFAVSATCCSVPFFSAAKAASSFCHAAGTADAAPLARSGWTAYHWLFAIYDITSDMGLSEG